ncbi:hypothetical protein HMPREF0994_05595 [Lachnospiraceae bacterium 3_1_57FAA_CT1]|nr:hypothetical protein HMPREF0994_05595 [Lachnospiraceae bacterium 3_1_57FAA_CT1]
MSINTAQIKNISELHFSGCRSLPASSYGSLLYLFSGNISLSAPQSSLQINAKGGALFSPHTATYTLETSHNGATALMLSLDPTCLENLLTCSKDILPFRIMNQPELFTVTCHSLSEAEKEHRILSSHGYLCLLLDVLQSELQRSQSEAEPYRQAIDYIAANLHLPPTVCNVAKHISLSNAQLYRIFMLHAGCSPKQYINDQRITKACRLICSSSMPINLIGYAIGFKYESYFYRWFKNQIGITPSEYRMLTCTRQLP